jgi:hypothetical protein
MPVSRKIIKDQAIGLRRCGDSGIQCLLLGRCSDWPRQLLSRSGRTEADERIARAVPMPHGPREEATKGCSSSANRARRRRIAADPCLEIG